MHRFIAGRNLERFRRLLASETNVERRTTLEILITEEEEKWAELTDEDNPGVPKEPPEPPNLS